MTSQSLERIVLDERPSLGKKVAGYVLPGLVDSYDPFKEAGKLLKSDRRLKDTVYGAISRDMDFQRRAAEAGVTGQEDLASLYVARHLRQVAVEKQELLDDARFADTLDRVGGVVGLFIDGGIVTNLVEEALEYKLARKGKVIKELKADRLTSDLGTYLQMKEGATSFIPYVSEVMDIGFNSYVAATRKAVARHAKERIYAECSALALPAYQGTPAALPAGRPNPL